MAVLWGLKKKRPLAVLRDKVKGGNGLYEPVVLNSRHVSLLLYQSHLPLSYGFTSETTVQEPPCVF